MSQIIYFKGKYIPIEEAKVSILDRGYAFGDGIYEAVLIMNGKFIDFDLHMTRFARSLKIMNLVLPEFNNIDNIIHEVIKKNNKKDAFIYLQVTRGDLGAREHNLPYTDNPTFLVIAGNIREYKPEWITNGIKCIVESDARWQRRDIKSLNLLPNIMAKQKAISLGFDDAIFVDGGTITEATSSNVLIVDKDGVLKTHPATNKILDGITKNRLLILAKELGIPTKECSFTEDEMFMANEVMLTNSGYRIRPVTQIYSEKIGNGRTGIIAKILIETMEKFVHNQ